MVVENVKGAQKWVGPSKANFGSFHLYGDIGNVGGAICGPAPVFGETVRGQNPVNGVKCRDKDGYERTHADAFGWNAPRTSSRSSARKAASAQIAKIPYPLAQYVARVFNPSDERKRSASVVGKTP